MRLVIVFIIIKLLVQCCLCDGIPPFILTAALYCPLNVTSWAWVGTIESGLPTGGTKRTGKGAGPEKFQIFYLEYTDGVGKLRVSLQHTCTKNGKYETLKWDPEFSYFLLNRGYGFKAVNLLNDKDTSIYEKLFVKYLNDECEKTDCFEVRDRVYVACRGREFQQEECITGFDKALPVYCGKKGLNKQAICKSFATTSTKSTSTTTTTKPTTPKSSLTIIIIIGVSVGIAFLITVIICFLCLKKRKSADYNDNENPKTTKKTRTGTTASGTTSGKTTKTAKKTKKKGKKTTKTGTKTGEKSF